MGNGECGVRNTNFIPHSALPVPSLLHFNGHAVELGSVHAL